MFSTGWRIILVLGVWAGCIACGSVFTPELRSQIDPTLSFAELIASPASHVGRVVRLAGTIVDTTNLPDNTRITILQYPIGSRDRPNLDSSSSGRFLILAPGYLEAEVYRPGRPVSVIGEIKGREDRPLGETTYTYPVITPKAVHLWSESELAPRFRFSFGVGFSKGF